MHASVVLEIFYITWGNNINNASMFVLKELEGLGFLGAYNSSKGDEWLSKERKNKAASGLDWTHVATEMMASLEQLQKTSNGGLVSGLAVVGFWRVVNGIRMVSEKVHGGYLFK